MGLRYKIIDTTLREGEQHEKVAFSLDDKLAVARMLADFGVDYIEVTSPFASPGSFEACRALVAEPLGATRVVAHVRCLEPDLERALETGVTAINMVIVSGSPRNSHAHITPKSGTR
jgi:homocitrate synthase